MINVSPSYMREIGSEFWEIEVDKNNYHIFPQTTQWYLSGRSALQAIIKELNWAQSVSIPALFCESMVKPFIEAGIRVSYYPVYVENGFIQEISYESDILFVMDYFGYTTKEKVVHPCIIRDMTHSIFSSDNADADYYFGSLRKWTGIWTGGYAWSKDGHMLMMVDTGDNGFISARSKAMFLKYFYINRTVSQNNNNIYNKKYLDIYKDAEDRLKEIGIAPAAKRDIELARMINVDFIRQRRRDNAKILMDAFPSMLIFPHLKKTDCPMFVPILVPDGRRDELRQYLIKRNIYCPIHWPLSRYHQIDKKSKKLYDNELSLICDQRYSKEDMNNIVKSINLFLIKR